MRVVLFGASGMVGQGVLRECVRDEAVTEVLAVGRSPLGTTTGKVRELVCGDLFDLAAVEAQLAGFDACLFCLGVSSGGMTEAAYTRVTYELTLSVARTLLRLNPGMVFEYVSGAGTDSSERGRTMWARVKGRTENGLLGLGFRGAYMLRPGVIQPLDGIVSKTKSYWVMYAVIGPVLPLLKRLFPKYVTSTEELGKAMIAVAKVGIGEVWWRRGRLPGLRRARRLRETIAGSTITRFDFAPIPSSPTRGYFSRKVKPQPCKQAGRVRCYQPASSMIEQPSNFPSAWIYQHVFIVI